MIRNHRYLLLILFMGLTSAVNSAPPLTIVSDIWPPFVTDLPEKPGVDVEVMQAVFKQMGVAATFRVFPWKRALSMTELGQADALLDVFKTEDRLDLYWFPDEPISSTETALFCIDCDPTKAINEADFEGKTLIVNRGYQYARFGNDPTITTIEVNTFEQGFRVLLRDRASYYLVNRTVGLYTIQQMQLTNVSALSMAIDDPSDVYLAFHKSPALEPISLEFSDQLRQFKQTADYQAILAKYGIQH